VVAISLTKYLFGLEHDAHDPEFVVC
jgi:hypothetical protein